MMKQPPRLRPVAQKCNGLLHSSIHQSSVARGFSETSHRPAGARSGPKFCIALNPHGERFALERGGATFR
ncbi:protein of unknown function [Pseudomonas mediterranea]